MASNGEIAPQLVENILRFHGVKVEKVSIFQEFCRSWVDNLCLTVFEDSSAH